MEDILLSELADIKRNTLLAAKRMLTVDDLSLLTGLSKPLIYKLTSSKQLPCYKPHGKALYFDREEIEFWLKSNPVHLSGNSKEGGAS